MCFTSYQCLITLFVFMFVIFGSNSCYIRNCPRGGKRSMEDEFQVVHKCMACGPDNSGHCVGPQICCGTSFGCYIGTKEAKVCEQENASLVPCKVDGEPCGTHKQGQCVADRLCCDSEACSSNSKCEIKTSRSELVSLLQRLLKDENIDR